jgi:LacI family transcriptional regulator
VPEDVGVLGIGDDELLCEFTVPRLSSITVPLQEIGRQAAAALELLLRGRKMPRRQIPIAPIDIAMRGSTERLGTSSHPVLAAVQYIKSTSGRSVGIGDVAEAVGMPRRTMERRFKRELGITVHDWIIREKLSRARELLKRSWTPVAEVAQRCGYSSQSAFVRMFTQGTGMHPLKFRSLNRG